MQRSTSIVLPLLLVSLVAAPSASACTILCLARDGHVLVGNNEDFTRPGIVWFVPAAKNRLGRINVGFDKSLAQGSMNEKGLCFDSTALPQVPWKGDLLKQRPKNLLDKIMDECGTVSEAIAYFRKYDCPPLAEAQFLFADASGASAVIAWLPETGLSIVERQGDHQVVTNSRLEASGYRCPRFARAEQVLAASPTGSLETMTAVLSAVHQRGPGGFTSYSTVYDLPRRKIYLYNLADFTRIHEFDLGEELSKGAHTLEMASLFPGGATLADVMAGEQRAEYGTRVELPAEILDRYAGEYRPDAAPVAVRVVRAGKSLLVKNPGQPDATLQPESKTMFRILPDRGTVSFRVSATGVVEGLTLHKGRDVYAARVISPAETKR
jgi:hypothetical protein